MRACMCAHKQNDRKGHLVTEEVDEDEHYEQLQRLLILSANITHLEKRWFLCLSRHRVRVDVSRILQDHSGQRVQVGLQFNLEQVAMSEISMSGIFSGQECECLSLTNYYNLPGY